MDILFGSKELRALCVEEKVAQKRLGTVLARKLKARLADLKAATRVKDLVAGRPHPLGYGRSGQFAVDLDNMWRLTFEAADDPLPLTEEGKLDWPRVTCIRIVYLGDYHHA